MKKRFLSVLFALCMVLALLPTAAFAFAPEPDSSAAVQDNTTALSPVALPFYSSLGDKTNFISVDWGWGLFQGPALTPEDYETYDNRLATAALALSAAAEMSQEDTQTLLTSVLGFDTYDHKNYDSSADLHPAVNFACKELVVDGQTQYIFAIVVRGTGNDDDVWTDISSLWGGFDIAADHLSAQFDTFMGNTSLPDSDVPPGGGGRIKFFVTGHSLGGAMANILAQKLSGAYGAENVFAYTFASPRVLPEDHGSGSGNIYNIINSEDWVPAVPPNLKGWNGLPVSFSRRILSAMEDSFSRLTGGLSLNSLMAPPSSFWESGKLLLYPHFPETYMSFLLSLAWGDPSSGETGGNGPEVPYEPEPSAVQFTDVPSGAWYCDAVYWAVRSGIANGTSDTTFSPNDNCTQVQILTLLWRAAGQPASSAALPFPVNQGLEYAGDALRWAYEKGMIGADFDQSSFCARAAAVKYLWQAAGSPAVTAASFADVPAGADYAQAVAWAVAKGVTNGTGVNTFSPNDICTRGQIVTFLYRDRTGKS